MRYWRGHFCISDSGRAYEFTFLVDKQQNRGVLDTVGGIARAGCLGVRRSGLKKCQQEEKRESREGKDINKRNPDDFLEYNRIQDKEIELLRTVPPNLRPYYKEKVNQYFYYFDLR